MNNVILWILRIIGTYFFFLTGELLLFVISFGNHSMSTAIDKAKGGGKYAKGQLYFEAGYYIGMAFWILVVVVVNKYVL